MEAIYILQLVTIENQSLALYAAIPLSHIRDAPKHLSRFGSDEIGIVSVPWGYGNKEADAVLEGTPPFIYVGKQSLKLVLPVIKHGRLHLGWRRRNKSTKEIHENKKEN